MIIKDLNKADFNELWLIPEIHTFFVDDDVSQLEIESMEFLTTGIFYGAYENNKLIGAFLFYPFNRLTCTGHMMIHPAYRHLSIEAGRAVLEKLKETQYTKLIGFTPTYNVNALKYVKKLGFKLEGNIRKSIKKNGQLHDQIITGYDIGK